MNKILKRLIIGLSVLAIVLFIAFQFLTSYTKKASPEDRVEFVEDGKTLSLFYCQPSKKDREIFGGLIPYDVVWRTGANEASTFSTSHDLNVGRQILPAGKYTLWTIPSHNHWTVIFNDKMYSWGVNMKGKPLHDPAQDVLRIDVPVQTMSSVVEKFTILLNEAPDLGMEFNWDQTKVRVPMSWK